MSADKRLSALSPYTGQEFEGCDKSFFLSLHKAGIPLAEIICYRAILIPKGHWAGDIWGLGQIERGQRATTLHNLHPLGEGRYAKHFTKLMTAPHDKTYLA